MDRAINGILRRKVCCSTMMRNPINAHSVNVRKTFLDYFEQNHNHLLLPSSPVLPLADRSLGFINSGMAQFKGVFLGRVTPASKRVANSQKCIRLKGKHNDYALVGIDGTHHTFFEMLGNWSFGDYFKKEACSMAWDLLTKVYGIPPERLYVTYFAGEESLNLQPDLETREIWAEIGVPVDRILPFGMKDNFWEMARTGPCGPCTEIHYCHNGCPQDASALVNSGSPLVTELWNLVFMQYNRRNDSSLEDLGRHYVDTGMGFERLVAILQGQASNYETDLFHPLFKAIHEISGHPEYTGRYGDSVADEHYRIVADHARMITVALSDGMVPSIHNRIRAALRRVFFLGNNTFKVNGGLLQELSKYVVESLSPAFPELGDRLEEVLNVIALEEDSFKMREIISLGKWCNKVRLYPQLNRLSPQCISILVDSFDYFEEYILNKNSKEITADNGWILFDRYGLPTETIQELADIWGLEFKREEFEERMKTMSTADLIVQKSSLTPSESMGPAISALGLPDTIVQVRDSQADVEEVPAKVVGIIVDGQSVDSYCPEATKSDDFALIFDRTNLFPFHDEYDSDRGTFLCEGGTVFKVKKVKKIKNQIVHVGNYHGQDGKRQVSVNDSGKLVLHRKFADGLDNGNTALHLFRTLASKKCKAFLELQSFARSDSFYLNYSSYGSEISEKDIMELENTMVQLIKGSCRVDVRQLKLEEFLKETNMVVRKGYSYIEEIVPVVEFSNDDFNVKQPCVGPFVKHTANLKDFIIVKHGKVHYRTKQFECLTGEEAQIGRKNNELILKTWERIRNFHLSHFSNSESIEEKIEELQVFLKETANIWPLSCYLRTSIRTEATLKLEKLQKYINRGIRKDKRDFKKSISQGIHPAVFSTRES
ncbi:UNVERIFIED_CONTAM: hypothetical protein PYX00_010392 [Menopon gallinae]|uniref:alanine--tRNA ligase n=1 Tax=Menopon gallinae TaxID=328185 RepID=A0AAW2HFA5_9NEOP